MEDKELIWVEKPFAEKYNKMTDDKNSNEERLKVLDDYIDTVCKKSRDEFKANLDGLEEDVAIYTGLMLKVKQAFEKAKDKSLDASYSLWEEYAKEMPGIDHKVGKILKILDPLQEKINNINDGLSKIRTYDFQKLIDIVEQVTGLYGKNKEMFTFLVNNFKDGK